MTAARNTNPPKAPNATIAPRFNLAPWDSLVGSFSTLKGILTLGDWSDLKAKKKSFSHPAEVVENQNSLPYVHTARNFIVLRMSGQNNILWILCRCIIVRRQWTNLKRWRGWIIRLYIFRLNINSWSSWWKFFTNSTRNYDFFRIIIGHIIIGICSCRWICWSCCRPCWSFRWSCFDWCDWWQNSWSVWFRYCKLVTLGMTIFSKIILHSLLKQAGSNSLHCPDSKHVNVFGPSNL